MHKHLGVAYLGGSGSGLLIRLWLRCWPGLRSSVGLTMVGGSLLRRPTQHARQSDAGCGQEDCIPFHVDLSKRLPEEFHDTAAVSLRENDSRKKKKAEASIMSMNGGMG